MSQAVYAADLVKIAYATQVEKERSFASSIHRLFAGNNVNTEEKLLPTIQDVLQEDQKSVQNRYRFSKKIEGDSYKNVSQLINNVQGFFVCGPQYHYHMETQTTLAVPTEDGMDIYASTQWIDVTQRVVAQVLAVKENTINIKLRRLGGAFGAKIFRNGIVACATAVACYHQHRPIRMVLPMETNMRAIGKRMPAAIDYNVNFTDIGTVLNLHAVVTHDLGITPNDYIMLSNLLFSANAYITATWLVEFKTVITDAPTNTWMRAPGSTEMIAYTETIMEHMAWALEKDPIEVRLANILPVNPIRVILRDFLENCEYYRRLDEVNQFNRDNRWKKRGIAITLMQYPHANLGTYEALVSIYHGDGSVVLYIAGIEMGQGLYTKTIQIAAHVLGISLDKVKIAPPDNVIGANSMVTAGSFTSDTIGHAVKRCCEILNERLEPIKLLNPTGTWEDTVQAAYLANVELIATYQFTMGEILPYIIYGVACAEIEIDVLTGSFQLRRVDIVEDTGESISPRIDVGQVEGAFIMGMGYWLHEKLIYNRSNGELLTNRSWNYKPPGAKDIPVDFRVTLLQNSTNPLGVLRSKICSEPAVTMAVVVVSALRKALESARKDAGEPDIFLNFSTPTTVEDILKLAGTKNNQFVL
ncbi:aldehyde oxidase 3-like [Phlebotomus papatasi]|nr:aldehyde oxidase 3-like [Phlebotomus papatasi]